MGYSSVEQKGEGNIWSSFEPAAINHLADPNNGSRKDIVYRNLSYLISNMSPEAVNNTVGFLRVSGIQIYVPNVYTTLNNDIFTITIPFTPYNVPPNDETYVK